MESEHNYMKQILNIVREVSKGEPGFHEVSVAHDEWCGLLKDTKNKCNCNPEVQKGVRE